MLNENTKSVCNDLTSIQTNSSLMRDIYKKVLNIAKLDKHVIIIGEIGSGKKRLAHTLHMNSSRSNGPFHSFYCVDIDETEYKDAFWEHIKFEDEHIVLKYDAIEKASNGILYLDQFSELPSPYMVNIIESFQKGCDQLFRYNEASRPRLVLSFNQASYQRMLYSSTWQRLLSLLDPISIMLPPLRERKEDIPGLIDCFLEEIKLKSTESHDVSISPDVLQECTTYFWPGNVRQLKNALIQGAVLSNGKTIQKEHLPFSLSWKLPYRFDNRNLPDK